MDSKWPVSPKKKNIQEPDSSFYRTSKFDLVAIALVVFLSIGTLVGSGSKSSQASAASIYQNDILVQQVALEKDRIVNLPEGKMQIEIKEGKVRVYKSDCPHRLCVNMGWIKYSGQAIVCVPNRVVIEVKSTSPAIVDTVVY